MTTVSDIIERLGGVQPLSELTGIPATTIYSWRDANHIPPWRQPALLALKPAEGCKPITRADFPVKEAKRKKAAA